MTGCGVVTGPAGLGACTKEMFCTQLFGADGNSRTSYRPVGMDGSMEREGSFIRKVVAMRCLGRRKILRDWSIIHTKKASPSPLSGRLSGRRRPCPRQRRGRPNFGCRVRANQRRLPDFGEDGRGRGQVGDALIHERLGHVDPDQGGRQQGRHPAEMGPVDPASRNEVSVRLRDRLAQVLVLATKGVA